MLLPQAAPHGSSARAPGPTRRPSALWRPVGSAAGFQTAWLLALLLAAGMPSGAQQPSPDRSQERPGTADAQAESEKGPASGVEPSGSETGSAEELFMGPGSIEQGAVEEDTAEQGTVEEDATGVAGSEAVDRDPLDPRHARWLQEVDVLILAPERVAFSRLVRHYQREAFIQQFWKVRDPFPRTVRNELKERWPVRVAEAKSKWEDLLDDRSRMLLAQGPPAASFRVECTKTRSPAEVWVYRGTDWTDISTAIIFYRLNSRGPARLWMPSSSGSGAEQTLRRASNCRNGAQVVQLVNVIRSNQTNYEAELRQILLKPRPSSSEWVHTFEALSTEMPFDAVEIPGSLEFVFPGRHQHRTVVQGVVVVSSADLEIGEFAGYRSYDLQINGEVLTADGELFESFRYKYGFPVPGSEDPEAGGETPVAARASTAGASTRAEAASEGERLPMAFQRYLRPGQYRIVVLVTDLNSGRAYRAEQQLMVPPVDRRIELPTFQDPETERLFAEATAAIAAGETGIRLIPPDGELHTGFTRFDALVSGEEVEKVRYLLDDKPILTRNRPPYQVSIDLGPYPDVRTIRAEALDAGGGVVADDELLINTGGYRFTVKLRDPRPRKIYTRSLQARMEVDVPQNRSLDRVELFLDEARVATLYQEPFVHPIALPETVEIAYVRAVAYLDDGNSTEDLVFINAPGEVEELEVQFVELYTSVLDRQGRPVTGLARDEITVLEDGVVQDIVRFEQVRDLPIHVGVLLDTSASMVGVLDEVRRAALAFFDQAITPKDRAAVITFSTFPELEVGLTGNKTALGAGLAGLAPEGRTALYDSVMFSLYYFAGVKGQRAILVLSDGRDESSRFDFDQTLEYARRAGITVYSIGLRIGDPGARRKLARLAEETGGSSHFIRDITELESIYGSIEEELRSQLLVAYQSSNTSDDEAFRQVEVRVSRSDVTARTISGYYP